ncbi:T7SS effector LXG polymorphic toxin [Bacillus licheniformis]|nr:T7SS effector LXG polymorphic toxin [Bacillus licheniformis]
MKTLDVQALHKAIDQTVEQLKQQSEEIVNIKKRGRYHVAQRCLKRKGGDAIRNFIKSVTPHSFNF